MESPGRAQRRARTGDRIGRTGERQGSPDSPTGPKELLPLASVGAARKRRAPERSPSSFPDVRGRVIGDRTRLKPLPLLPSGPGGVHVPPSRPPMTIPDHSIPGSALECSKPGHEPPRLSGTTPAAGRRFPRGPAMESGEADGGGEGGIRTHVTVSRKHAFQACSFSHSDTSPRLLDPVWSRAPACSHARLAVLHLTPCFFTSH